jgi:PAS domain S-box-containing protein
VQAVILRSFLPIIMFFLISILIGLILYIQKRNKWEQLHLDESKLALQESENKYRGLFLNFRDAMMIIKGPNWKFVSGNPAALKMFGVDGEKQFLGLSPMDLSPSYQPDGALSQEKSRQMIETALAQGSLFFEWVHKRFDGQEFPAQVLLAKMELSGEIMLQVMVRDMTESKRIEEENRKHLQELEVFYKVSMGREERIIELKKEVNMLKQELERYKKAA